MSLSSGCFSVVHSIGLNVLFPVLLQVLECHDEYTRSNNDNSDKCKGCDFDVEEEYVEHECVQEAKSDEAVDIARLGVLVGHDLETEGDQASDLWHENAQILYPGIVKDVGFLGPDKVASHPDDSEWNCEPELVLNDMGCLNVIDRLH